jgi:hypothetical protein
MQTPQTNSTIQTSLAGSSRSLEMKADSRSTHHRNHLPDDPTMEAEEAAEVVEVEVVEAEVAEEDYPHPQDQACFLHMDELLTQSF